ncbi:unnamed protein product [Cylindrotheca closterium]|uniref:Uncharacterized protein n=1 Tax=Cylindrotheca closterium TaxID=2856 RepID=A0AAD2PXN2_9STRA|nr:unnamed protein product [Cylindrotheca closterium]
MNFGYKAPKKDLVRQRPPELVLIAEDENGRSPNTSLLIEKKLQDTPDTAKLADDMVGGENWEFQMDPFDTWSHEKENNLHAPRRVDGEMPKRSFIQKALCRKPKMNAPIPPSNGPIGERLSCIKPKQPNRSRSVPRSSHRSAPPPSRKRQENLFQTPQKLAPSPTNTPSKYQQQLDEFVEVSATPKQLNRVSDLDEIEQREKERREEEKNKTAQPAAAITTTNATYSQPLVTPALDDGNSVVLNRNASVHNEIVSLSEESRSVVQQQSDSILSAIRCGGPLCNAGEMLFMAVGPESPPELTNEEKASTPPQQKARGPEFEHRHRSLPVSTSSYLDQSLASSFQARSDVPDMKEKRVQSFSPGKNNNIYSKEAFEEEIRQYQQSLRESRNQNKMEDIEERDEYGESASPDGYKNRRAMHQSTKQRDSYPHRRSRSVGRSVGRSETSSSSSSSSHDHKWGSSARNGRKGRSKSTHRSPPPKRNEKPKHRSKEPTNSDLPRKRSDFMIAGMEMVTGDIERHRSLPKKEQHQTRQKSEPRRTRMKPEWMVSPNLLNAEEPLGSSNVFHSESGPVPVGDVISVPSVSNKLPIRTLEIPVMVEPLDDLRILEDATELGSAAFDEFDTESIYEDLKKSEKRGRRNSRSAKSYGDASEKYSRASRKSATTRHTDFTYGSASVEYDGCF